ncbi:MAG: DUF192 domain-containing protein [Candidatus Iainarchaeum archaeon]|uniref:DUF192 domain-containing protein n=1 Tax=Candidatus Iainarchaeum sp. TaxID=3101447 RepID=A0A7T9I1J1_9ARCH|nr:MAG: DUF192 domain-containing protein [Candidatus Diapherotrites archaeon]
MQITSVLFMFSIIFLLGCVQSNPIVPAPNSDLPLTPSSIEPPSVCVKEKCVHVQLAQTQTEKERGLMGVTSLTDQEGMLFLWHEEGNYPFWMKDTLIPLDIVWIQTDGTIVDIATLQPCQADPCPAHFPAGNASYVLETNAGLMEKWNAQVGDRATILMDRPAPNEWN